MSRLLSLRWKDRQLFDGLTKKPVNDPFRSDDCLWFPDGIDFRVLDIVKNEFSVHPRYLVSDSGLPSGPDRGDFTCLVIPDLDNGVQNYVRAHPDFACVDTCDTEFCFNFSVNISRADRFLMMKLVSWFGFSSYNYTWRGDKAQCDMTQLLKTRGSIKHAWMDQRFLNHILAPVTEFTPRWHEVGQNPREHTGGRAPGAAPTQGGLVAPWVDAIKPLMEKTAVTLLCESSNSPDRCSVTLSEKTMFSILAATFPIWVGSYQQADFVRDIGFDIFSDVIDHSYQYLPTSIERCYHAIADNQAILNDLDLARRLRQQHWPRLRRNQELLMQHNVIGKYAIQQARKLPPDIQEGLEFKEDGCVFPKNRTKS